MVDEHDPQKHDTMKASEFMSRFGITGSLITKNGPRIYVDRVRGRLALRNQQGISQRAYVDLSTYTAHCFTFGATLSPYECQKESREIAAKLAPVARLARILRLTAGGTPPPLTQGRLLYSRFHEAGVLCTLHPGWISLDMDRVVRAARVPWIETKQNYEVLVAPSCDNLVWRNRFERQTDLIVMSSEPSASLSVEVVALGDFDRSVVAKLRTAAEELVSEVLGSTWNGKR